MAFSEIEQESIILNSAWEMIDGMVNWGMFCRHDITGPTMLMFETSQHKRLFNILLGDFLSDVRVFKSKAVPFDLKGAPSNARLSDLTFLLYLRQVCSNPKLGSDPTELSEHVEAFGSWLEREILVEGVNLPDINVVADIRVTPFRYLKICGDIAKHNFTRLDTNVRHIVKLLEASGHPITEQDGYMAIEGFFDWFHVNIFTYQSSQIAEFLNNIRYAIFDYVRPEWKRAYHPLREGDPIFCGYEYLVPTEITQPAARAMYWDLMNKFRGGLHMRRFVVHQSAKSVY